MYVFCNIYIDSHLPEALEQFKPDIVVYNAGRLMNNL